MREPSWEIDGWELDNGEQIHAEFPETFWIPPRETRDKLQRGDYVKLIFRISLDDDEDPVSVERMWVVVRGRVGEFYFGLLDNEPDALAENDELWLGTELPFRAEHVIDFRPADQESIDFAARPPRRAWPRD
jgi:hypothetical protein